jgi:hypothetical protein
MLCPEKIPGMRAEESGEVIVCIAAFAFVPDL